MSNGTKNRWYRAFYRLLQNNNLPIVDILRYEKKKEHSQKYFPEEKEKYSQKYSYSFFYARKNFPGKRLNFLSGGEEETVQKIV